MPDNDTPHDKGSSSFIRRSLATTSSRLLDLPTRYGLHLLVAARMPIDQVGAFYIAFSTLTLASGFGRLGVDRALTREVAASLGRDLPITARKTIVRGALISLSQSIVVAGLLALLAKPAAVHLLHKPYMTLPLILTALALLPQNMCNTVAGILAGLNRVPASQMIYQWLWPGLFCLTALVMPLTVTRALEIIFAAMTIASLAGLAILLKVMPRQHAEPTPPQARPLMSLALSLFSLELVQLSISSAPAFALGIVASTTEVGLYALAWRIVLALNLLVTAMGAIASPQFARAQAQHDFGTIRRVAANSVGVSLLLSGIPLLALLLNPGFFLGFFGHSYLPAVPSLRILLIGQFAMILCATVPEMLGMTGHAKPLMRINLISMVVLLVGLAALTPHFGDKGAAAATSITMLLQAVSVTVAAKRDLGLVPLLNFYTDTRARLRESLRPATASDMPSDSDVQEIANSVEDRVESSRMS